MEYSDETGTVADSLYPFRTHVVLSERGTRQQCLKSGSRKDQAHDGKLTSKTGRRRNPARVKMKTLGSYQIPIGKSYRHPSESKESVIQYMP